MKYFTKFLIRLIMLTIITLAILFFLFNIFKGPLVDALNARTMQQTGYHLKQSGLIRPVFFPHIGFALSDVTLLPLNHHKSSMSLKGLETCFEFLTFYKTGIPVFHLSTEQFDLRSKQTFSMRNVRSAISTEQGLITLKSLTAHLYGGTLDAQGSANFQNRIPTYQLTERLHHVEAALSPVPHDPTIGSYF